MTAHSRFDLTMSKYIDPVSAERFFSIFHPDLQMTFSTRAASAAVLKTSSLLRLEARAVYCKPFDQGCAFALCGILVKLLGRYPLAEAPGLDPGDWPCAQPACLIEIGRLIDWWRAWESNPPQVACKASSPPWYMAPQCFWWNRGESNP